MTLLTLHRQAPVAPGAATCHLCGSSVAGTFQDHLLTGQPGTANDPAVICQRCGSTLARLLELFGPDIKIAMHSANPKVENLAGHTVHS